MNVTGISSGLFDCNWLSQWRLGERLLVEVVSRDASGEAVILLGGQATPALMETATEAGDRFWAVVRDASAEGLVLVRQTEGENGGTFQETGKIEVGAQAWLADRGLATGNNTLVRVISAVPEANDFWRQVIPAGADDVYSQVAGNTLGGNEKTLSVWGILQSVLPDWAALASANSGGREILNFWRRLGVEYESKLRDLRLDPEHKASRAGILRDSTKAQVLAELSKPGLSGEQRQALAALLDRITGQQLWFLPGGEQSAYMLWQLPLQNQGRVYEARIAIEAKRSGSKLDARHCRIALLTDTANLGRVGVDCWFGESSVLLKVLSDKPKELEELVGEVLAVTRERFAALGLTLGWVESGELQGENEFWRFIRGRRRSGVDIKG